MAFGYPFSRLRRQLPQRGRLRLLRHSADAQVLFAHASLLLDVEAAQHRLAAIQRQDEVAQPAVKGQALVLLARPRRARGMAVPVAEELPPRRAHLFDGRKLLRGVEREMLRAVVDVREVEDLLDCADAVFLRAGQEPAVLDGRKLPRVPDHREVIVKLQPDDVFLRRPALVFLCCHKISPFSPRADRMPAARSQ